MNLMNKKGTKTNQQNLKFSPANHSRFRKNKSKTTCHFKTDQAPSRMPSS